MHFVLLDAKRVLPIDLVGKREPGEPHHWNPRAAQSHDVFPLTLQPINSQRADTIGLAVKERDAVARVVLGGQQPESHRLTGGGALAGRGHPMLTGWIVVQPEPALADATLLAEEAKVVGRHAVVVEEA